jgi:hypothetical protein
VGFFNIVVLLRPHTYCFTSRNIWDYIILIHLSCTNTWTEMQTFGVQFSSQQPNQHFQSQSEVLISPKMST